MITPTRRGLITGAAALAAYAALPRAGGAQIMMKGAGGPPAGGGGGGITTAWDPATKIARLTLSGGPPATTVTCTANPSSGTFGNIIRSTTSKASGKWYFALDCTAFVTGSDTGIGFCDGSAPAGVDGNTDQLGANTHSASYTQGNTFTINGSSSTCNSPGTNFWSLLCIDVPNLKSYIGYPGFGWYSPGSLGTTLALNTGASLSTLVAPIFIGCQANENTDSWTINTGATAFNGTLSALITEAQGQGFSQWG